MKTPNHPFSIRIFLPDGTPDGVRILEKSNWTGCGVFTPRAIFPAAKERPEFGRTGVYILVGRSDDQSLPTIYVGQGDVVRDRLVLHYSKRDFWNWLVFFVSKDESLNRAHVQHLESRLIQLAKKSKRAHLDNQAIPQPPHLSEADHADVESFLADMLSILPLVGLTVFEKPQRTTPKRCILFIKSKGLEASGYEASDGFVVCKSSAAAQTEVKSIHAYLKTLRSDLKTQGVLAADKDQLIFSQDFAFSSPSTAAGVVLGRTANGRIEWQDESGRTLKVIQEALVPNLNQHPEDNS